MTWFDWNAHDIPCFFSARHARQNAEVLRQVLTSRFIERPSVVHPLRKLWDEATPDAYLRLNALAEDLRLLSSKEGIQTVVQDLRSMGQWQSAHHTLHTAALFERAHQGAVLRFLEAKNDTTPDFIVDLNGITVPVEAKMVVSSSIGENFERTARNAADRILAILGERPESYEIVVVVKDATAHLDAAAVASATAELPSNEGSYQASFKEFKIWAQVCAGYFNFREHRTIHVVAPVHEKDHLRLKGPAKKASSQLRALPDVRTSGILALGLTGQHEPESVFAILHNEMNAGNYRGIASSLLIKTGTHLSGPRRSVIDSLEIRHNPRSPNPIDGAIPILSLDLCLNLSEVEPCGFSKPAYLHARAIGRIIDPKVPAGLHFQDIRRIANQLLL